MWPQLIYLGLLILGFGVNIGLHGKPQKEYNAWTKLVDVIISLSILYWGGFFDCFFNG